MNNIKSQYKSKEQLQTIIDAAKGEIVADLVIKNGKFLDVFGGGFVKGDVAIYGEYIVGVLDNYEAKKVIDAKGAYIVPGFIDTHVHIESSMLTPCQFQKMVLPAGTTTVMWDPHEIANVKGVDGIKWAIESSRDLLLDVFIMLSSCVPAVSPALGFGTCAHELKAADLAQFLENPRVLGLAEMMNYPGVLFKDNDVLDKLQKFNNFICDGHCPTLSGKDLNAYAAAGIMSDHEVSTIEEAREKLTKGIHLLIREGSCAKNADALLPLLDDVTADSMALCTDDRNPLEVLEAGHIDCIINKALKDGIAPHNIFKAASYSGAKIYGLNDRGVIAPGFFADLCIIKPRENNWLNGMDILVVYKKGKHIDKEFFSEDKPIHPFAHKNINIGDIDDKFFKVASTVKDNLIKAHVIGVNEGQLLTDDLLCELPVKDGFVLPNLEKDILKITVIERYFGSNNHCTGFVKGFGIKNGAIAMSVNHDSHNVIVVGSSDEHMRCAVNELKSIDGGIVVIGEESVASLTFPVGGLMSDSPAIEVIEHLRRLKSLANEIGCTLAEPFLQLAFLALPVIPSLKITDMGLVDVDKFAKIELL